jgi:hypothetical protein
VIGRTGVAVVGTGRSLANTLHANLPGRAARIRMLIIDAAVGLPALTAAADRPGPARRVGGAACRDGLAGTTDAPVVKAAIRRSAARRRRADAVRAMTRTATRVINAGHTNSPAFAGAAQPGIGPGADATATIRARAADGIRARACGAAAMEARAGAALGIVETELPLGVTGNAGDATDTFAAAAMGVVGTRVFERCAGGTDAIDASRCAAARRADRALRADRPAGSACPVVAVAGAALGAIDAGDAIFLTGDANVLNAESGAAGMAHIARGTNLPTRDTGAVEAVG